MIWCKECGDIIPSTEVKNHYEITLGNNQIYVKEDRNITVDGNINTKSVDITSEISGDETVEIGGDKTETVGGNLTITVTGNINITSTGPTVVTAPNVQLSSASVQLGIIPSVKKIVNETFISLFNSHVHSGVDSGPSNTGPPTTTAGSSHITSETEAT